MQSYPFTSDKITYDEHGLPKYDRAVDSAFLRKVFAQYFSDGVFYSSANALQVVADTGMQVAVEPGSCHIQGAIGIETNRRTLVVQAAEEMDRIDTVVARLDLSLAVRSIDLYVVKGTAAESPQAPALTRDSTIWELGLANLFVAKNVATISQQRITDTRLDISRCGQVGAPVQPPFDTEAFFSQLEAAIQAHQEDAEAQIEQLRNAIEAVEGDAAWMMKEHYDPAGLGKDITVQTYTHSKSGTVHEFTGTGANGRAKMTADVQAGDTFTVNGTPVTAYMGTDSAVDAMAGSAWNGKWISFITEGGVISFAGGAEKAERVIDVTVSGGTLFPPQASLKLHKLGRLLWFETVGSPHNSPVEDMVMVNKNEYLTLTLSEPINKDTVFFMPAFMQASYIRFGSVQLFSTDGRVFKAKYAYSDAVYYASPCGFIAVEADA